VTDKAKQRWTLYLNSEGERVAYGMHTGEGVEVCPVSELESLRESSKVAIEDQSRARARAEQQAASMRAAVAQAFAMLGENRQAAAEQVLHRSLSQPPTDVIPDEQDAISRAGEEVGHFEGAPLQAWAELLLALEKDGWVLSRQSAPQQHVEQPECGFCQAEATRQKDCPLCGQQAAPVLSDGKRERIGLLLDLVEDPTDEEGELHQQRATQALGREVESTEYAEQVCIEARRVLDSVLRDLASREYRGERFEDTNLGKLSAVEYPGLESEQGGGEDV
jgi:hypothetical protein